MAKRDDNQISFEGQTIITKGMEAVMHDSMIPYAEYVIMERALPRIEDGLKFSAAYFIPCWSWG